MDDLPTEVAIGRGSFQASVPLQPGLNRLRVVATGPEGAEAEDTISIEYVPTFTLTRVVLTSPVDGFVIPPDAPPVIVVEGQVDDKSISTLWLVANERRIPVRVSEGRFRKVLPAFEPTLRLWAEASRGSEPGSRSQTVTIQAGGPRKPSGVLLMEWPRATENLEVEVSAVWRATPERLDTPVQSVRLPGVLKPSDSTAFEVFWLRSVNPGVYTVILRYRGSPPRAEVIPTLYLPDGDGLTARVLRPVRLEKGKAVLGRILLPYGVSWDQDEWFSGRSESADTVTKFRVPEGVSWVERKEDLR